MQLARQIDQRLRLILGRMLLGVAVEDGPLRLTSLGQGHVIGAGRPVQQLGDDTVLAFVDRSRARLPAQRAIDGLDCHLAGKRRRVGFPRRDFALAGLAGGGRRVQRLADGVEDGFCRQAEQRADAGGRGRAEMRDMVDLVLVQADGLGEVHLDFVAGGEGANEVVPSATGMLRDGEDRRNVVARVRIVGRQERVVVVELAHGDAIGPGGPFRADALVLAEAEHGGTRRVGMRLGLGAGGDDGCTGQRRNGDGRVVDDPVDDHLGNLLADRDGVGGDLGDLPCELLLAGELLVAAMAAKRMEFQVVVLSLDWEAASTCWRAWCRWMWVACAASSPSPSRMALTMTRCSAADCRNRGRLVLASRLTRAA